MTALSNDPFDPHVYGDDDPDDATVSADVLRCAVCGRYDESVTRGDPRCNHCFELHRMARERRLRMVEK